METKDKFLKVSQADIVAEAVEQKVNEKVEGWKEAGELTGPQGEQGIQGIQGEPGVSPTVTIEKTGSVTTITIEDATGVHTATINDGEKGDTGDDGVSPTVAVSKTGKTTTITIADKDGQHVATINDGEDGAISIDAPSDGEQYVRQNGEWVKVTIPEAKGDADDITFTEKESHTPGSVGEKIAKVVPTADGTEGQMLALDEDGNPIWKTPAVGGIEVVNIQLKTEDELGSVEGVEIAVSVDGETEERSYTTDANGKCSFSVTHGLNYTIAFGQIEGYRELADVTHLSSLTVRNITETYSKDIEITQEHVKVTLAYTGGDSQYRATSVKVIIGSETNSYAVVNNVAEFDVPLGTAYEISYNDVDSYATPSNHTYLAELHTRLVNVSYIGAVDGLSWIKYDGTSVPFEDVTADMKADIVGLRIATATLIEGKATFIVPLAYLLAESSIGNKQWCAQNVQFQQLPLISNQATALLAENCDGEGNTLAVVEEATNGSTTVTAGTAVPAFTACQAVKYTINGVEKTGFLGSFAQMKAFSGNRTNINTVCLDRFGKICIAVNSGYWWSSTQCSAENAVNLINCGWYSGNKTYSFQVVPFLAY